VSQVHAGQMVRLPILLRGEAENVQGIRTVVHYDATLLRYESSEVGSEISGSTHFFKDLPSVGEIDLSLALLGNGAFLQGEGEVMCVRFQAIRSGRLDVQLLGSRVRDASNNELLPQKHDIAIQRPDQPNQTVEVPGAFRLREVRPNPFTPRTTIFFDLPSALHVNVAVYDAAGRLVRTLVNEVQAAGSHAVEWDSTDDSGRSVGSGIYFCTMRAGSFQSQKQMALLK